MKRAAVLAHYDAHAIIDAHLKTILDQLAKFCDPVILVSALNQDRVQDIHNIVPSNVTIVSRKNVGYDFCSYRCGIELIDDLILYDQLIILNDSFYCGPEFNLEKILQQQHADVVGITENNEFEHHIQSYLLMFNKRALQSRWFSRFWSTVVPLKNKLQIVLRYEVGLTRKAKKENLTLAALLPNGTKKNQTHSEYEKIFKEFNLLKVDLFRLNNLNWSIDKLANNSSFVNSIRMHQDRIGAHYINKHISSNNSIPLEGDFFDYTARDTRNARIAIVLHLHYPELANEIANNFELIPENVDLFVSLTNHSHIDVVIDNFRQKVNNLFIYVVENKGRDVRPFILLLSSGRLNSYLAVLKIHGKKSNYSKYGAQWRNQIFDGLLPSSRQVHATISQFEKDLSLGIVAPGNSYLSDVSYWGANKARTIEFATRLGLQPEQINLFFIGGTMFWFRPEALAPLVKLVNETAFEPEKGLQDGTLAHVVERLFCLTAHSVNMHCAIMENVTQFANIEISRHNRVPVLPSFT